MSEQSINLENVSMAALGLDKVNLNINDAFRPVADDATRLDNYWNSAAGSTAQTAMHQLIKNSEARFIMLQGYVNFLKNQVNPGYRDAETTNIKLADQFK